MKKLLLSYFLAVISFASWSQGEWVMVWQDEFNYKGLPDTTKWTYDVGSRNGWGNRELQYYTYREKKNARVENGNLVIEARKENIDTFKYSSARLLTKGKAAWQYAKIEVRAKLPKGVGSWPAIWTLSENMKKWPDDGEIDIMEHVGYDQGVVHGTIHCRKYNHVNGTQRSATIQVPDCSTSFHIYSMEWDKDEIRIAIDGKEFFSFSNENTGYEAWPFDNKMYLILNIAVGGNWGGQKGVDNKAFPMRMEVDYVRVYQKLQNQ